MVNALEELRLDPLLLADGAEPGKRQAAAAAVFIFPRRQQGPGSRPDRGGRHDVHRDGLS